MKLFFLCLILPCAAFSGEIVKKEFDSASFKKLEISLPKGEISIMGQSHNSKKILVSLEKIDFAKNCKFNLSESVGVLGVKIEQENALFDKVNCVAKLKVEIPSKLIDLDVSSGTALIKIVDIEGVINFKTATGAVDLSADEFKNIDGKTATGNLRLALKKCSHRADIDLVTATGDTEIYLPATCKIKVNYKSATGSLFNELGESEDSLVLVNQKSATGGLKIKKLVK